MMRAVFAFALIVAVYGVSSSTAWAKWGCAAKNDQRTFRMWSEDTEAEARKDVLKNCQNFKPKQGACKIISCRDNVDSQDQAHAIWPTAGTVDGCYGDDKSACQMGRGPDK
jgi:hypothetical protein